MEYTEDSDAIFPFNTTDFSITDEDNIYLYQAVVTLNGILTIRAFNMIMHIHAAKNFM